MKKTKSTANCENPNNLELYNNYKKYRNKTNALIQKCKSNFYSNQIENNKNTSKKLWEIINESTSTKSSKKNIKRLKNNQGEVLTDEFDIANELNNTFANMGKILAESIKKDNDFIPSRPSISNSFVFEPIDEIEIKNAILDLKNKKSVGIDKLKAETIKNIAPFILEPLSYLLNKCVNKGIYPSAFKQSIITPLYKKGDTTVATNYRPISLVTHLSKIFEKIIKKNDLILT